MDYTTLATVKNRLSENGTGNDVDIQATIDAACRAIDRWCGRSFGLTANVARRFARHDSTNGNILYVGDIVVDSATTVELMDGPANTAYALDDDLQWEAWPFDPRDGWPREASQTCLLYTSPSPRDRQKSRMPSSA